MISSRKCQFVIVLILACVIMSVWAAEPNESKAELKFVTRIETMHWAIVVGETEEGKPRLYGNPGPVKPSYVAQVLLHEDYPLSGSAPRVMERILESPIAKKFSKEQQQFFETELAIRIEDPQRIPFYYSTWLYATSQEDAKLMVRAYIDGLNKSVEQRLSSYKQEISKYQQEMDKSQKELPEKQKQLKEIEQQYKSIKEATHRFSSDEEAAELSKKSIIEMDKALNALDIELVGIREKLKAIEKYKNQSQRIEIQTKLDEMYIELMIELSGLEGRREITGQIRAREQKFLSALNRLTNLMGEIGTLNARIDYGQQRIDVLTSRLNTPRTSMQPPKVYQNTATIFPVLTDN